MTESGGKAECNAELSELRPGHSEQGAPGRDTRALEVDKVVVCRNGKENGVGYMEKKFKEETFFFVVFCKFYEEQTFGFVSLVIHV